MHIIIMVLMKHLDTIKKGPKSVRINELLEVWISEV